MDLVVESLTDEEIITAIDKTGKKGLAWDCLAIWVLKLISKITVTELMTMMKEAEVDTYDIDLS